MGIYLIDTYEERKKDKPKNGLLRYSDTAARILEEMIQQILRCVLYGLSCQCCSMYPIMIS